MVDLRRRRSIYTDLNRSELIAIISGLKVSNTNLRKYIAKQRYYLTLGIRKFILIKKESAYIHDYFIQRIHKSGYFREIKKNE